MGTATPCMYPHTQTQTHKQLDNAHVAGLNLIFLSDGCNFFFYRTLSFGLTDQCLIWWSVQLQMMSVFSYLFITKWWRSWMRNPCGILLFVDLSTADVSA